LDKLQFRISSELKSIIGRDLITDDFIAISELVKNSYDANARKVEISFRYVKNEGKNATIIISDDGDGMTLKDLKEKWLLVGYSKKAELQKELAVEAFKDGIGKKRIFAGAKGIGRFSCDKLGSKLELYTKTEQENSVDYLEMDWDKFEENPNTQFQDIDVFHDQMDVASNRIFTGLKKGTILKITCLRDRWNRAKLLKLKRHLQRLINPAQIDPSQEFSIYLDANEFADDDKKYKPEEDSEIVIGLVRNVLFENMGIKTTQINVKVEKDKIFTELFDKGEFIYRLEESNEYKPLLDVDIKIFFLNPVAKTTFTKTMGIEPVKYGSVFFYKNGIKVNPYGNVGDDWLGLDRRKTQGTRRFLGNRDLMGRIEVSGYQPAFREVSSRDGGVTETEELNLLKEAFREKALKRLEKFVIEGINWDSEKKPKTPEEVKADSFEIISQLAGRPTHEIQNVEFNKNLLNIFAEKQVEKTPEIISNIESIKEIIRSDEDKAYIDLQVKAVRTAFRNLQKTKKTLEKQLKEKELFLKYVAQDERGDIAAIKHQVGLAVETIKLSLDPLETKIKAGEPATASELTAAIDAILMQLQTISIAVSFLPLAKFAGKAQEITQDMAAYVKQYIEKIYVPLNEAEINRLGTKVTVKMKPEVSFESTFNPYEVAIVVDNLVNNSKKAGAKNITITVEVQKKESLLLKFKDDGKGISDEVLSRIFSFGYTTTGGTGIGLYHVKKILENQGSIRVNNKLEKGVEFIVEFRKQC